MLSNTSNINPKEVSKELLSLKGISCIAWNKDFTRKIIKVKF
jgi:hypothetical protein